MPPGSAQPVDVIHDHVLGMPNGKPIARKRKAHKNSRLGCANCKLRSIKCDETKPCCKKCQSFGVRCIYGHKFSPDTLSLENSFKVDFAPPTLIQSLPAPLPVSSSPNGSETYQLVPADMPLIEKFQLRTALTFGSQSCRHVYAKNLLPVAFSYPFVMHAILALAEIHDSTINLSFNARETVTLTYHWYHAVSSLQRKMAQNIVPSERDALWISVSLISIGSFATIEANKPAEAWPLRPPSAIDLSWLKLCDGKKLITQLTDPLREDSCFRDAARELHASMENIEKAVASDRPKFESLPSEFHELFELPNGPLGNPYYDAVIGIAEILRLELCDKNFLRHICYASILDGRFRTLLHEKDKKAMLLLLYWYAKICDRRLWWLWKQAWTEGFAICEYLGKAWAGKPELISLLEWPFQKLTIASSDVVVT